MAVLNMKKVIAAALMGAATVNGMQVVQSAVTAEGEHGEAQSDSVPQIQIDAAKRPSSPTNKKKGKKNRRNKSDSPTAPQMESNKPVSPTAPQMENSPVFNEGSLPASGGKNEQEAAVPLAAAEVAAAEVEGRAAAEVAEVEGRAAAEVEGRDATEDEERDDEEVDAAEVEGQNAAEVEAQDATEGEEVERGQVDAVEDEVDAAEKEVDAADVEERDAAKEDEGRDVAKEEVVPEKPREGEVDVQEEAVAGEGEVIPQEINVPQQGESKSVSEAVRDAESEKLNNITGDLQEAFKNSTRSKNILKRGIEKAEKEVEKDKKAAEKEKKAAEKEKKASSAEMKKEEETVLRYGAKTLTDFINTLVKIASPKDDKNVPVPENMKPLYDDKHEFSGAAIEWLNKVVVGESIKVEATKESYELYFPVSKPNYEQCFTDDKMNPTGRRELKKAANAITEFLDAKFTAIEIVRSDSKESKGEEKEKDEDAAQSTVEVDYEGDQFRKNLTKQQNHRFEAKKKVVDGKELEKSKATATGQDAVTTSTTDESGEIPEPKETIKETDLASAVGRKEKLEAAAKKIQKVHRAKQGQRDEVPKESGEAEVDSEAEEETQRVPEVAVPETEAPQNETEGNAQAAQQEGEAEVDSEEEEETQVPEVAVPETEAPQSETDRNAQAAQQEGIDLLRADDPEAEDSSKKSNDPEPAEETTPSSTSGATIKITLDKNVTHGVLRKLIDERNQGMTTCEKILLYAGIPSACMILAAIVYLMAASKNGKNRKNRSSSSSSRSNTSSRRSSSHHNTTTGGETTTEVEVTEDEGEQSGSDNEVQQPLVYNN